MLPCHDTLLRSRTTQRQSRRTLPEEWLEPTVEREMSVLFQTELSFLTKLEDLKRDLVQLPAFDCALLYKAIDLNSQNYFDQTTLRRFLIKVGH